MEIGAVKQAFNTEVIHLKQSLNQAKIHTIHKLTRKAKTLVGKKTTPEKLKRKAESAINEVLIIKKIKPRDIARFTVTHTGNLQDFLNKPTVDHDKACARLLLHKSLQEKYKVIRNSFSSIPIKDLLMSRQERKKLQRQALLDQKAKKGNKKQKVVNAEGQRDVETIKANKIKDASKNTSKTFTESNLSEEMESDEANSDDEKVNSDKEGNSDDEVAQPHDGDNSESDEEQKSEENNQSDESDAESEAEMETNQESDDNASEESDNDGNIGKFVKPSPARDDTKQVKNISSALTFEQLGKYKKLPEIKKPSKPKDMHKNKNLKEKLQSRKLKKESHEEVKETKVVDPFFITSTGENYMSVAEPRQPDEVKEIHKQGNRKERRAVMFGHAPKAKPRQNFRQNNSHRQNDQSGFRSRFNQSDDASYNNSRGNDGQFKGKKDQFKGRNNEQFEGRNNQFKGRNDKGDRHDQFKGKNDSKFKGRNDDVEPKVEKLHPSWEAKKKQSGILPFQGKKIVFDEG